MECGLLPVVRMLPADETKNTGAVPNAPSPARRRLLQGGLATGPVLMTIASRPVLGQSVCTASASVSVIPVNSLNHAHAHVCEEAAGLSPERWKAMAPDWPSPYVAVLAPVVQDPASPTCTQTTAPAPTTTQTTTAPSAYDTYRTRRTELYASRGLTTLGGTTTTTVTPTTTATPTTSTTCTSPTVAPASTQTTTTTTTSAYDSYRTQRAQLYANRGLTGLVSNPPAPTTTTSTTTVATAPIAQPTYTTGTTASAPTTTQTTTSSSYTYRSRGTSSPFIQGSTSTASAPTTTTTSTPTVTSGPLVGPAGTNGTAFHCPTTGLNGQTFASLTMLDVLSAGGGAYDALGRYTVAALLNAKSGRVHVLPESTVRNMWNDCVTRGYYEPAAGVRWGAAEIVAYMQKTIA